MQSRSYLYFRDVVSGIRTAWMVLIVDMFMAGCYSTTPSVEDGRDSRDTPDSDLQDGDEEETPPALGRTGDPCADISDCDNVPGIEKTCIKEVSCFLGPCRDGQSTTEVYGFEGGYCSAACTSNAECGEGGECTYICGQHVCMKPCSTDQDCRTGYHCWTVYYGSGGWHYYCVSNEYNLGYEC